MGENSAEFLDFAAKKFMDPALRVPFVFAIDWFLSTFEYSSLYSLCKFLPGIIL
jgi:hypothetical protein